MEKKKCYHDFVDKNRHCCLCGMYIRDAMEDNKKRLQKCEPGIEKIKEITQDIINSNGELAADEIMEKITEINKLAS